MRRAVHLALVGLLVVAAGAARAQPAPSVSDAAKEMVGGWELSNADHDRRCTVTFSTDTAPGGFKLALDQGCAAVFPMFKDLTIWNIVPNGALRLLDGKGNATLELSEVESGIFEGERRGEGLYFMQPQGAVTIPVRTPEQMFGDWNFLRELDRPLCGLTLSRAAAVAPNYKLIVKPGCDAAIANFALLTWRLEGDQLVFTGRGGSWRFVESDTNIWERIPPSTNPLLMLKP
ncbi:MAG TPA: AprI/Inh family metalloprotease inhibitor [Xanthobacteraceae bacterium]